MSQPRDLETEGVWKIVSGGMVRVWATLPEYVWNDCDVPFWFGPHYHLSLLPAERDEFIRRHKILKIIQIVEVFREPFNDVDSSFRGRGYLIASFATPTDALLFKLAIPSTKPPNFRLSLDELNQ